MNKSEEEFVKKYVKLSNNARTLTDNLKDFNFNEFVEWWIKNRMIIGDSTVLEYLLIKRTKNDNQNK